VYIQRDDVLTVRELIAELKLPLLAGESGLDLPIRWVHISELPDPTPWLSGGEVLLSTGMQLGTPERQRQFVRMLSDRRLAGLGFGVGLAHAAVPPALVRAAVEHDFPLFEIPYELPFIAVTEAAFSKLVNEQYAVVRRALQAQERLERVVLSERGLDALAGTLATLVGATVLVFDGRGGMLGSHVFRRPLAEAELETIRGEVLDRIERRDSLQFMPEIQDPGRALAIPVPSQEAVGGAAAPEAWLVAVKDDEALSDFDRLALRQAVTIVALELLRERVAGDTERRLAGDVLAGLLAGELAGGDLKRRLEPFGLPERVATFVLPAPATGRGHAEAAAAEAALSGALRAEATSGLVAAHGQLIGALIPGMPDDALFALGERVAGRVQRELPTHDVRIGVGRAVPIAEARRSYHEARCTVEALAFGLGHGGAKIATYRDLGSFQLLLSLQDDEALKLFCDSVLGPIEQSEGYYGGELVRSLEAFIEENGQWERAAQRLFCHRHTLRYRIRRVEELTGRNLGSARDRIEFWLALRGRELTS
jgi:PucR family transcriptional regulator, purine catabolism regulatory protein